MIRRSHRTLSTHFSLVLLSSMLLPGHAEGQLLGKVDFPNSGAQEAKEDFIKGVLYLHNFEYEDAGAAFKRAPEIDLDFAMAPMHSPRRRFETYLAAPSGDSRLVKS